ncbi:MAG: C-type lectin domain-containing protein [Planctomycetota bacterium]
MPKTTRRRSHAWAWCLLALTVPLSAEDAPTSATTPTTPPSPLKQPDAEAVEQVQPRIEAVFTADLARGSQALRAALARQMVDAARDDTQDPVMRYAIWRLASLTAARAEANAIALEALALMLATFEIKDHTPVFEVLRLLTRQINDDDDALGLVEFCGDGVNTTLIQGDLRDMTRYAQYAETAGRRVTQRESVPLVKRHMDAIEESRELLQRVARAEGVYRRVPDNAVALRLLGMYEALVRRDPAQASAYWEKASDPTLAILRSAWANPDTADVSTTGQAWLQLAKAEQGMLRTRAARRAAEGLERAANSATGLDQIAVEQQLAEAHRLAGLPAGYSRLTPEQRDRLVRYGNRWVLLVRERANHQTATAWAADRDATLVSITSPAQNRFLNRLANESGVAKKGFWAGASDQQREGNWRWDDGSPWRYANWGRRQPDGNDPAKPQNFLKVRRNGDWEDTAGGDSLVFFVQWEIKPAP